MVFNTMLVRARRIPSRPTVPQCLESLIHEKLSKVTGKWGGLARKRERALQGHEIKLLIDAIKQLDKHTLNMYTPLRTGLGTRELSWIRLDFTDIRADANGRRFQEEWQQ